MDKSYPQDMGQWQRDEQIVNHQYDVFGDGVGTCQNGNEIMLGMKVLACLSSTWEADHKFENSLGFVRKHCLKSTRWSCLCHPFQR